MYSLASVFLFYRFIDNLIGLSESIGVLRIIFGKMYYEVGRWFCMVTIITLGFSVAFTVMMPGDIYRSENWSSSPFLRPWWCLIGDFDRALIEDYFTDADNPE